MIYAGYSTPPRRCGQRAPDRYLAHVFLDGVIVSVNVTPCFCVEPEERDHDAYDTLAGMKTVVEAIRPRS